VKSEDEDIVLGRVVFKKARGASVAQDTITEKDVLAVESAQEI
jgi:hypothetical protein